MKIPFKKLFIWGSILAVAGIIFFWIINLHISSKGERFFITTENCPKAQTAIVLGAAIWGKQTLSHVLEDRVLKAIHLYKKGLVKKLLMSGSHSRTDYDEVNAMRIYAEKRGVPKKDIFMDHAGFTTYETMYRARDVFQVKSAVIVTQQFHLARSVYIARQLGIIAYGYIADRRSYVGIRYYRLREFFARIKAWLQAGIFKPLPTYLGRVISIIGDGRLTHDKK